ncbi:MAG: hypothetical protein WB492_14120 [Christiangramia sp.]
MDTTSLIIGILLFIAFMFPILYVLLKQKSKENKNKKLLNTIATKNDLNLDRTETFGHLSLGLDSSKKKLVIIEYGNVENSNIVDLTKVDQIRIAKKLETSFSGNIKKEKIVHLALELAGEKQNKLAEITFYDEDDYDSTDAEIRLNEAKKWDDLLQKNLAF